LPAKFTVFSNWNATVSPQSFTVLEGHHEVLEVRELKEALVQYFAIPAFRWLLLFQPLSFIVDGAPRTIGLNM